MKSSNVLVALLAAATAVACNAKAGGAPATQTPAAACPRAFLDLPNAASPDEKSCSCPPGNPSGSLWGVDLYTQDSSPCMAAVHAGVIQAAAGGTIRMKSSAGCPSYQGAARNGVTSSSWGSYPGSFYFPQKGEPRCAGAPAAAPLAACPAAFNKIDGLGPATEITCQCAGAGAGSVWGVGTYTQDSSICQAALHAGLITAAGGKVTAKAAPGCPSYAGSAQNGVTSGSWGSFPGSFFFPAKGNGSCSGAAPAAPVALCPASFGLIANLGPATEITCDCDASNVRGSVWGTGPFTQDSSICNAAVHAGLIPQKGGRVTAKAGPGCKSYAAANASGVTTSAWGSFPASFDFPAKGSRACP